MQRAKVKIQDNAIHHALANISKAIASEGGKALLVGGCVRDTLLGSLPQDFDVEVYGIPFPKLLDILSRCSPVSVVGETFGVIKVHGLPIDISIPHHTSTTGRRGYQTDMPPDTEITPQEAASRRDFTMNAMALDPLTDEILDYFGGRQDLEHRILRHTSEKFREDPLRVLRGHQLAGRYALTPAPDTLAIDQDLLPEYDTLAIERIWAEWYKWAAFSTHPSFGLNWLRQTQWIQAYPELVALQGCPQDRTWHPEGDVWTHTLLVTDEAARIAHRDNLSSEDRAIFVLSALCHDLGKPATTEVTPRGIHSRRHAQAQVVYQQFLQRLGTPRKYVDRVTVLCLNHLSHLGFAGSSRHVRRLALSLSSAGESIDMLSRLVEADVSGRPPLPKQMPETMTHILYMARKLELTRRAPRPLLFGRHLIDLGIQPGPEMGHILKAVFEAQLDGKFDTIEAAKDWALTYADSQNSDQAQHHR